MEILYSDAGRKTVLSFKCLIQAFPKIRLNAQSLENKNAHPDKALLGRIISLVDSIKQDQHHKIVRSVRINDERPKTLVTLKGFPKEHNHFRGPSQGFVAAR